MKMAVFWVVAPCSLVEVYQRFRDPCCLHHQGDRPDGGATTQKTAIFDFIFVLNNGFSAMFNILGVSTNNWVPLSFSYNRCICMFFVFCKYAVICLQLYGSKLRRNI
jgi:hypothetical protein